MIVVFYFFSFGKNLHEKEQNEQHTDCLLILTESPSPRHSALSLFVPTEDANLSSLATK